MPKKIVFDGMNLGLKRGTGVATYTRSLVKAVRDLGHSAGILYARGARMPRRALDREVAFFDISASIPLWAPVRATLDFAEFFTLALGTRPKKIPQSGAVITLPLAGTWVTCDELYTARNIYDRARGLFTVTGQFARVSLPRDTDLFHWTYPLPLTSSAKANIYTVHDIVPVRLPYTTLDWKRYYLRSMRAIAAKADHIVTVSEHSKRDIVTYFGVDEKRITNTYQAVNIPDAYRLRSRDVIAAEIEGVFGLEMGKYLLFFGSLEPKKNIGRVVQGYLAAKTDLPLVVIVAQSWLADEETRLLDQIIEDDKMDKRIREKRRIHRYDYMPFRLLVTLIQGARAVLCPSLYEGFGLPVLEAMSLGTPVITSNTSSIPEVAGDAAIMVDPYDVDAIRKAIVAIDSDKDLRADLRARGIERAKLFSPEIYQKRLDKLYSSLV